MFTLSDWSAAAAAPQTVLPPRRRADPIPLRPKSTWVLAYQWGATAFNYVTWSDPSSATSWSSEKSLFAGTISNASTDPIDQTIICDATDCYLFFAGDNGSIYQSSMPIDSFPAPSDRRRR